MLAETAPVLLPGFSEVSQKVSCTVFGPTFASTPSFGPGGRVPCMRGRPPPNLVGKLIERESLKIRINPQKRKALQDALDQEDDNDAAPAPKKRKNRQVEPESPLRLTPPAPSKTIPMKYFESPRHASHSQHNQAFRHRSPSRSPTRRSPPPRRTSYSRYPSRGRSPTPARGRSPTPAQGQAFSRRSRTPSWSPTPPPGVTHGYKHSHAVILSDPIDDDIDLLEEDHDAHGGITDKSQFLGTQGNDHLNIDAGSTFDPEEEEGVKASNDEADEENQGDHDPDESRERLRAQWEEYRRSKQQRQREREQSGKGGGSTQGHKSHGDHGRERDQERNQDRGREHDQDRDRGRDRDQDRDRGGEHEHDQDRGRGREHEHDQDQDRDRGRNRDQDRARDQDQDRRLDLNATKTATTTAGRNTGVSATKTMTKTVGLGDVEGPLGMKTVSLLKLGNLN
ncbi:hypothetical protein B0H16DRAFT_1478691 [Mycena metata]|uniref:Uncharacterized protein n=1 Tax=Mycena metata TaxID=1033252 RepID=A0AAD7H6N4_9AGAR|nr:hypothetical protein B0H16DRAFT_1478691 [Mycena metata]